MKLEVPETFEDVAVDISREEGKMLSNQEKELHGEVMQQNYEHVVSVELTAMETKNDSENAPAQTQAACQTTVGHETHTMSRRQRNRYKENMRLRSDRQQQAANGMNQQGQQDFQSLQAKIQGLSEEELRQLCTMIAERNPELLWEILEEQQERRNIANVEHHSKVPPSWCVCHCCRNMPTAIESVCCGKAPMNCLSFVSEMSEVVLHKTVLHVADRYRRTLFGLPVDTDENHRYRHCAYRQFTVWHYGRIGSRAPVIPSCCVWRIRDCYPDALGQYTGFQPKRKRTAYD
ncbi:uncharacterized protein LOC122815120 [Protopterus annectens]|uniref:uncharacterized protein LOC122815120 n=1 Tax=Protopterus annectens TaxID=7888 RepID=UPI001CFB8AED|nr:uncharacterized protein LOC122815120 [Protopterus annectens]